MRQRFDSRGGWSVGRRKNREPRVAFRLSVSRTAHEHLERLLGEGYSGATLPEVAVRVLEGRLAELRKMEREDPLGMGKAGE